LPRRQSICPSGFRKPETYESYLKGVSEPLSLHACDSSQDENGLVS
jgi:hypothetical protein